MKTVIVLLLASTSVFAAVPQVSVEELLSLPDANRKLIAQMQSKDFYKKVVHVAFNEQKPMSVRWKALMLAADMGKKSASEDLVKASKSNDWFMRNASLIALKDQDEELSFKVAKKLIQDKALVVRSAAVDIVANSKNPEARGVLWEELNKKYNFKNSSSLWIRAKITESLAEKPEAYEKNQFVKILSEKDVKMQQQAVTALEKITGNVLGDKTANLNKKVALWKKATL